MKNSVILSIKDVRKITDSILLEKELNNLKSVKSRVNIASRKAIVKYKEKTTPLEKILDVILDCGFFAIICDTYDNIETANPTKPLLLETNKNEITPFFNENFYAINKQWNVVDLVAHVNISAKMMLYTAYSALKDTFCDFAETIESLAKENGCFQGICDYKKAYENGAKCIIEEKYILAGDENFMKKNGISDSILPTVSHGFQPLYIIIDGVLSGFFVLCK